MSKSVLEMEANQAKAFFLKEKSFCSIELPKYFSFQKLLDKVSEKIERSNDINYQPNDYINYPLLSNKDGKFSWRPLQIIHPLLYVLLVHKITIPQHWEEIRGKFKEFQNNTKIVCCSIPHENEEEHKTDKGINILNWWEGIEQESIKLSLRFQYLLVTDITDCYGSIYTHSIPWALHTKEKAKEKKGEKNLIGNIIDTLLQKMSYNQTNGIPQGSVLMDFIGEIVLGYADLELTQKIDADGGIKDYHILRYRDDYRIFTNNPQDASRIAKYLSEILQKLGMKLNPYKTDISDDVIKSSIKSDKLYGIISKRGEQSIFDHLILIHSFADKYPNSGTLQKLLIQFLKRIEKSKKLKNVEVLISILTDIAYKNPRIYPVFSAILSHLLDFIKDNALEITQKILDKFKGIPNTSHLNIWLQRLTLKANWNLEFPEVLCKMVIDTIDDNKSSIRIWKTEWVENKNLKNIINNTSIINKKEFEEMSLKISSKEIDIFNEY